MIQLLLAILLAVYGNFSPSHSPAQPPIQKTIPLSAAEAPSAQDYPMILEHYVAKKGTTTVNFIVIADNAESSLRPSSNNPLFYFKQEDDSWYLFNLSGSKVSGIVSLTTSPVRIGGWTVKGVSR